MAMSIPGLRVGTFTSPHAPTGCTVLLAPAGTVGAVAVRGAAPGTREAAALGPFGKVEVCHAVVLAGGSAYGLAAADGVMRWCEEQGIGYPTSAALVPIVGAAIVLDQGVATPDARPDAAAGRAACEAATENEPPEGDVGAGTGCTVAKVAGLAHAWRGGQGVAVRRSGELVVAALVVNNAVGEVIGEDGRWVARARVDDEAPRYPANVAALLAEMPDATDLPDAPHPGPRGPSANTVIGCVVTNARLTKLDAHRVADLGHSGIARALRPAHTSMDGDALFCLATGQVDAVIDQVTSLAAEAVAEATRRGPLAAHDRGGLPGLADANRA